MIIFANPLPLSDWRIEGAPNIEKMKSKKSNNGRGRMASVATSEVKCVAKVCKYTGINSSNKAAVGVCAKCSNYEHFECSKTNQEDRDEILKGERKYFCSLCFGKKSFYDSL